MWSTQELFKVRLWAPRRIDVKASFHGWQPDVGDVLVLDDGGPLVVRQRWFAPPKGETEPCWHLVLRLPMEGECVAPWETRHA